MVNMRRPTVCSRLVGGKRVVSAVWFSPVLWGAGTERGRRCLWHCVQPTCSIHYHACRSLVVSLCCESCVSWQGAVWCVVCAAWRQGNQRRRSEPTSKSVETRKSEK